MVTLHVYKILLAGVALIQSGAFNREPEFRALSIASAEDSAVTKSRISLVQDNTTWQRIWREHSGYASLAGDNLGGNFAVAKAPAVDFKESQVIALFGGNERGVSGYDLVDLDAGPTEIKVLIRPRNLGVGAIQTSPYIFIQTTITKRKLAIWMDAGTAGQPAWRLISTLTPKTKLP